MSLHVELSGRVEVAAAAAEALRFFTPEGERLWVPDWVLETFAKECPGMLAEWERRIGYAVKLVPPKPRAKADGDAP